MSGASLFGRISIGAFAVGALSPNPLIAGSPTVIFSNIESSPTSSVLYAGQIFRSSQQPATTNEWRDIRATIRQSGRPALGFSGLD